MATSGNTIILLKELLQEHGQESESQFLCQLSPQSQTIYHNVMLNSWIPMLTDSEIKQAGAKVLFPNKPEGLFQLQRMLAQKNTLELLPSKKKYLTIKKIANSVEKIWNDLWRKGKIHVEKITDRSMTISVSEFPELIQTELDMIRGYFTGILDLTGAQNIQGKINTTKNTAWQWHFHWK